MAENEKQENGKEEVDPNLVSAKYKIKDENGNVKVDAEGKPVYAEVTARYDFDKAWENVSEDIRKSNFDANVKVTVQSRMRSLHQQGVSPEAIQTDLDAYLPGMVTKRVAVDPIQAAKTAFASWSPEKQKAFLKELQGK